MTVKELIDYLNEQLANGNVTEDSEVYIGTINEFNRETNVAKYELSYSLYRKVVPSKGKGNDIMLIKSLPLPPPYCWVEVIEE